MADWDRIAASAPISRQAAIVRDGRGADYDPEKSYAGQVSIAPPKLRPVPKGVSDLTEQSIGRFKVIGLIARTTRSGSPASWAVRCACGLYTRRTHKALSNPVECAKGCARCRDHAYRMKNGNKSRTAALRQAARTAQAKERA